MLPARLTPLPLGRHSLYEYKQHGIYVHQNQQLFKIPCFKIMGNAPVFPKYHLASNRSASSNLILALGEKFYNDSDFNKIFTFSDILYN